MCIFSIVYGKIAPITDFPDSPILSGMSIAQWFDEIKQYTEKRRQVRHECEAIIEWSCFNKEIYICG